jgi:hypothetical protein
MAGSDCSLQTGFGRIQRPSNMVLARDATDGAIGQFLHERSAAAQGTRNRSLPNLDG